MINKRAPTKTIEKELPFVSRLFKKLASRAGVEVIVEPKYGYVGQIICPNGKVHYYRNTHFDLNSLGSAEIAKDKDYASYFLSKLNYPVIEGKAFYSKEWCEMIGEETGIDQAYEYAKSIGFPVIIKPNSKSQGVGVYKVVNKRELYAALRRVFKIDHVALVQRVAPGNDFRILVLDGKVISAYQRIPLSIMGDGIRTVAELQQAKKIELSCSGRDSLQRPDEFRLELTLKQSKYSTESILADGEILYLVPNANLCSGGSSIDFSNRIHPDFEKLCVSITNDMGLRYCGVDLMVEGTIDEKLGKYVVVEINSAPGIDNFAASGEEQTKLVEELYLQVLKAIAAL